MIRTPLPVLAALLAAALAAPAAETPAEDADGPRKEAGQLVRKAQLQLTDGRLAEARETLQQALEREPAFPPAHLGLGHIAMAVGNFELALQRYRQAGDGYRRLGESLVPARQRRHERIRERIQRLQDALAKAEQKPDSGEDGPTVAADLRRQIQQLKVVQPPGAYDDPKRVPAEVFFYLGNAYFQSGQLERAEKVWTQCRERHPGFAMVYNQLAIVNTKQRETRTALDHLEKARALGYPVDPDFLADLREAASGGR